jgi:hypothetical protein
MTEERCAKVSKVDEVAGAAQEKERARGKGKGRKGGKGIGKGKEEEAGGVQNLWKTETSANIREERGEARRREKR